MRSIAIPSVGQVGVTRRVCALRGRLQGRSARGRWTRSSPQPRVSRHASAQNLVHKKRVGRRRQGELRVDAAYLGDASPDFPRAAKVHLNKIYGFISTLDGLAATNAAAKDGTVWTPELIRRQFDESQDTIKRFQKILANHPERKFLTSEVATQLKAKRGSKTMAGALGAYGRRTQNRYKMQTWPFKAEWNHAKGEQTYWMEADVAAVINGL